MRRARLAVSVILLFLAAEPLVAATYYVGSCKAGAYGTINAALAAVPAGSTIDVCPGTYPEQVIISKAISLYGMSANKSSQPIITVPAEGLATTSSLYLGDAAAQIEVTAEAVKIKDITVDGSASTNCPSVYYAGILYGSGSSGSVNEVETRNQNCTGTIGYGIVLENGTGPHRTVTVENSDLAGPHYAGVVAYSESSTLTAIIENNFVGGNGEWGILTDGKVTSTLSGNTVVGAFIGLYLFSGSITATGNTVTGGQYGFDILSPSATASGNTVTNLVDGMLVSAGTVTSNNISSTQTGIFTLQSGTTVENNTITNSSQSGITFNCRAGTVTGNIINGAPIGLNMVPGSFTGVNTFYNAGLNRNGGC
jgi:parallel beta-helix repeat protein